MSEQTVISVPSGHNFRDFGGYATDNGHHVRRGMLFRSGVMAHLNTHDAQTLRALGIQTICDLRTLAERTAQPTCWQDSSVEILADDDVVSTATLQELLANPDATGADMTAAMVALYAELPFKLLPMYRLLMRRLADGQAPLVVNCSAGKDRTGVAVAIVQRALGVSHADIQDDYLLSNTTLDLPRLLADSGYGNLQRSHPDVTKAMMAVTPVYLDSAFQAIDARHGSFEAYLATALQIDKADLQRMRAFLLE